MRVSLGVTVAVLFASSLTSVALAQQVDDRGALVSVQSARCLGSGGATLTGACDAGSTVTLVPLAGAPGVFQVRSDRTHQCLFSNGDGRFGWYTCSTGYANQLWSWLATAGGTGALRAFHSGRCLSSEADGRASAIDCSPTAAGQRWRVGAPPPPPPPVVADAFAGDWDWWDGAATACHADGTFLMPNDAGGHWRAVGGGRYEVSWSDGRVDRLRMSPDGTTLDGDGIRNGRHTRVAAHRRAAPTPPPDCGAGPNDLGCAESRNGLTALRADAFTGFMASLRATGSELSKRDMVLAAARTSGFTAAQLMLILDLFRSELTQLDVLRVVAPRVVDPQRALGYAARMRSSRARAELVQLLSAPTAPPPQPAVRVCAPIQRCSLYCAYGLAQDANGCAVCACAATPGSPGVTGVTVLP